MSILNFSDGVSIDTSGPLRRLELKDGLYVVGEGKLIPMNTEEEVKSYLDTEARVKRIKESKTPNQQFMKEIANILK